MLTKLDGNVTHHRRIISLSFGCDPDSGPGIIISLNIGLSEKLWTDLNEIYRKVPDLPRTIPLNIGVPYSRSGIFF